MIAALSASARQAGASRRRGARRELERLLERVERELDAVAARRAGRRGRRRRGRRRGASASARRPRDLVRVQARGAASRRRLGRVRRPASRARASVSRTDQPASAAVAGEAAAVGVVRREQQRAAVALGERRRASSSSSTSSGRSSRRIRFETATRLRPTRRPTSSRVSPSSSTSARAGARLLDRVEVLAGHVLDQRELERLARRRAARTSAGIVLEAGELRGAPAALAGDQLVACRPGSGRTSTGCSTPRSRTESASAMQRLLVEASRAAGAGSGAISSTGQLAGSSASRSLALRRGSSSRIARAARGPCRAAAQPRAATSLASSK